MRLLCRLLFDVCRYGTVREIFITTQEDLDKVWEMSFWFSEELGKHTEWEVPVKKEGLISVLTADQDFIGKALEYGLVSEKSQPWWRVTELTCESCGEWSLDWDDDVCPSCGDRRG